MSSIKQDILSVLRWNPKCREDDLELVFALWEKQGLKLDPQQKSVVPELSKPGTIVRTRAHIQNIEKRLQPRRKR